MLKRLALATAAIAMLGAPALQAQEHAELTKGEMKLAKMLDGRVAGEPERCIRTIGSRSITSIDDTALVYRDGDTIWVNYTRSPGAIDDSDYMVIDRFSATSLCRTDHITTYSRAGNFFSGVIFLDDFVPYRAADAEG
ncbi:hypothetical protein [Erythrobacter sp. SD-21]|uniref:hypothetical protein n=1 Tax=Erythrobacter sp. SD-21 TaxID=161528 RepID=UPI000153F586|nr:hypothetical protein [Erythrobacter sp. SD-21]EDL49597.1 hypothetical protein ED21_18402 [Erythrobacter sp. SD-21]